MTTALITGVGGFVGTHLAELARVAGHRVVGLDRLAMGTDVAVDLLDPVAVRTCVEAVRPDVVFHLAGALRAQTPKTLYDVNVVGTANLFEALVDAKLLPRVVVVSSSAVYGNPPDERPLTEQSELRPLTHYGASKAAQELVARRYFTALGLPVVVARMFNIIGPGQPGSLAAGAFAEQAARAESTGARLLKVGDLSGARDFVDVRDVARACLALAERGAAGAIYNVASGALTPMQRCVDELLRLARVPLELVFDETRARANDARAQVGDATRIAQDTGWSPEVPFNRSIEDLLTSWRQRLDQAGGAK